MMLPAYIKVKQLIEEEIKQLIPNAMIKSERDLAKEYEVSRMTARKAVDELIKEGKLYRKEKVGTFVADNKLHEPMEELVGFTSEFVNKGMKPQTKVISYEIIEATDYLANKLEIKVGEKVHRLLRVRMVDDRPMTFENTYIPLNVVKVLPNSAIHASLYAYIMEELEIKIATGTQNVSAVKASVEVAKLLDVPLNDPLIYLELTSFLMDGKVLEYVETYANPKNYKVTIHSRRKW
ncbi:MAG TPA: GntR family transcriptional regulator [Firmicutes bacterium]|nr:GntR family transcriptional regulator [Bacillota bacterium]